MDTSHYPHFILLNLPSCVCIRYKRVSTNLIKKTEWVDINLSIQLNRLLTATVHIPYVLLDQEKQAYCNTHHHQRSSHHLILLLLGGIEPSSWPRQPRFPCTLCQKAYHFRQLQPMNTQNGIAHRVSNQTTLPWRYSMYQEQKHSIFNLSTSDLC